MIRVCANLLGVCRVVVVVLDPRNAFKPHLICESNAVMEPLVTMK